MILISMPYYNSPDTLRGAVESILEQSYKQFTLLILNDGSVISPKDILKIKHPRLKYFELASNRGRYFADAVSLMANPYEYFMPTDADDISDHNRLKYLVENMRRTDADFVYHYQKLVGLKGKIVRETYPLMQRPTTRQLTHLAHWSGLYKTDSIRAVGGPHPDFRVAYDTLIVNLLRIQGKVSCEPKFLYTRYQRSGSLTKAHDTGFGSQLRRESAYQIFVLYRRCLSNPLNIRYIIRDSIMNKTYRAVEKEAKRLKSEMGW